MTTGRRLVHRRPMRLSREPRGPGARFAMLTQVGWLSLAVAVGWLGLLAEPWIHGDPTDWAWDGFLPILRIRAADLALVALPAALEWGVPGARRRVPLLFRGAVLLAVLAVAGPLRSEGLHWAEDAIGVADDGGPSLLIEAARLLLSVAISGARAMALWWLASGLRDAGAWLATRWERRLAGAGALLVLAGVPLGIIALAEQLQMPADLIDPATSALILWGAVTWAISLPFSAATFALWFLVAGRLVAGRRAALRPRPAWVVGAAAGVLTVAGLIAVQLATTVPLPVTGASWLFGLTTLGEVLLPIAFAMGVGRGRVRREAPPRRVRQYELQRAAAARAA